MYNTISLIHKALKSAMKEDLVVNFPTKAMADQFRITVYNAIRPVKQGKFPDDFELNEAVKEISIVRGKTEGQLVFQKKINSKAMKVLLEALNMTEEEAELLDLPDDFAAIEAEMIAKDQGGNS